jgi:hypothetical protein
MKTHSIGCLVIAIAVLLGGPAFSVAQTAATVPPHVPVQKAIGQAGPDIIPSLIVMNSRGATLQGGKAAASRDDYAGRLQQVEIS